jgi:hypothetical protein
MIEVIWSLLLMPRSHRGLWMRLFSFPTSLLKSEMDSIGIVRLSNMYVLSEKLMLDWAYLEDFCRRLTTNFEDVYVFTYVF